MKKIAVLFLCVASIFVVAGCSNKDADLGPAPKGDKPESVDLTQDQSNLTPQQQELLNSRGASGETQSNSSEGDAGETEGQ
ncbi:MAG: hypothetical protein KDC26_10670 [Armatimonadetes bacterium]|nr:hypothetical protein [Armatimonadota bacterium]